MDLERFRGHADCRQLEKGIIGLESAVIMTILAVIARIVIAKIYEHCMLSYIIDMVPLVTYLFAVFMLRMIPNTNCFKGAIIPGILSLLAWAASRRNDYLAGFEYPSWYKHKVSSAEEIYNILKIFFGLIALTLLLISLFHVCTGIVSFMKAKEQEVNFKSLVKFLVSISKRTLWLAIFYRTVIVLLISIIYIVILYKNVGKLYDKAYAIWAHEYLGEEYLGNEDLSKYEELQGNLEGFIIDRPSFVISNYEDVLTDKNTEYSNKDKYKRVLNVKKENIELLGEEPYFFFLSNKCGGRDLDYFAIYYKDKVVKNGLYLVTLDDGVKVGLTANINLIDYILNTDEERVNLPGSYLIEDVYELYMYNMNYWDFDLLEEWSAVATYCSTMSGYGWEAIVNMYCMADYSKVCLADFIVAMVMMVLGLAFIGLKEKEYYLF